MSDHHANDFHSADRLTGPEVVRELTKLARDRLGLNTLEHRLKRASLKIIAFGFLLMGVGFVAVVPCMLVVRPLTPAFEKQVDEPAVFGFLALSFLVMSLIFPGPFGHEGWMKGAELANTPARARLIYLLPLRQARKSARKVLAWCLLPCCCVAAELARLAGASEAHWWRAPWGALLLWMLVFLPATVRRWRDLRRKRRFEASGQVQARRGCVMGTGGFVAALMLLLAGVAGDQLNIWFHLAYPSLVPGPELVGSALRWLPHAGIMAWLNGGAYPWAGTVAALACGAWTMHGMRDALKDRHADVGLDENPSLRADGNWPGMSILRKWADAAGEKIPAKNGGKPVREAACGREEVRLQLHKRIEARGDDHLARAYLKHTLSEERRTLRDFRQVLLWSFGVVAMVFWSWWLKVGWRPQDPLVSTGLLFLTLLAIAGLGIALIVLLAGKQYTFRLPEKWSEVPVDIRPSLAVFAELDRRQFYVQFLWMLNPLLCLAFMAGVLRMTVPDFPPVRAVMPYVPQALGWLLVGMTGFLALQRATNFAQCQGLSGPAERTSRAQSLLAASSFSHIGSAVAIAFGIHKEQWWCGVIAVVLMFMGERLRRASFLETVKEILSGRTDRAGAFRHQGFR